MTVSNIAVYASLCALATFDRKQIQTDLIQSRFCYTLFVVYVFKISRFVQNRF